MYYIFILLSFLNIPNSQQKEKNNPIIYLERTMCYGTCPAYKIEIFNNEEGYYYGGKFVKHIGVFQFSINKEDISLIIERANEINFFDMKNEYSEKVSDLPTTYIEINNKRIKDYYGSPKELKDLESLIDKIALKNLIWKSY